MRLSMTLELIRTRLAESARLKEAMRQDADLTATVAAIAEVIVEAYGAGRKVLLCGNGGSAAEKG